MVWLYSVRVQVIIIVWLAHAIFSFHQILYSVEIKLHKMSTVCMFLTGWQPTTTLTTLLIYCETGSPMYRNSTIMWSGGQRRNQGLPCFFTCGFTELVHYCISCTTFVLSHSENIMMRKDQRIGRMSTMPTSWNCGRQHLSLHERCGQTISWWVYHILSTFFIMTWISKLVNWDLWPLNCVIID